MIKMKNKKTIMGYVIGALATAVLTLFKENWLKFIISLWGKLPKEMKAETRRIVEIVDELKSHKAVTVIEAVILMTTTDKDDKAIEWLKEHLAQIVGYLRLTDVKVADLNGSDKISIATKLLQASTGISHGQALITMQNSYENRDKKLS